MHSFLKGSYGKSVIIEGNVIKILKEPGIFAEGQETVLQICDVISVEVKKPDLYTKGYIQFCTVGGNRPGTRTRDLVYDKYSMLFEGKNKHEIALKMKNYVDNHPEHKPYNARPTENKKLIVKETKATCVACGNVWYFGKQEELLSEAADAQNSAKYLMCCSGCLPALFIPDAKKHLIPINARGVTQVQ